MAYGSFNNFSLGSFFSNIDGSFLLWIAVFLFLVFISNTVLSKFFKKQKSIAVIISLVFSALATFSLYKSIDLSEFFYGIGYMNFDKIIPWIVIILLGLLLWKVGIRGLLMVLGGLFIVASSIGLVYEKGIIMMVGVILFLGGAIWTYKARKRRMALRRGF